MSVNITFSTDNDAFVENYAGQVASCLRQVAISVEAGFKEGMIFDFNGNTVGRFDIGGDDAE